MAKLQNEIDRLKAKLRLEAAAPDLLAALKLARSGMQYHLDSSAECGWEEELPIIDAAIAKAEGRE